MTYGAWNILLAALAGLCGLLLVEMLRSEAAPRWVYGTFLLICLAVTAFVLYKSIKKYQTDQKQPAQDLPDNTRVKLEEIRTQRQKALLDFLRSELLWIIMISAIALSFVIDSLRS